MLSRPPRLALLLLGLLTVACQQKPHAGSAPGKSAEARHAAVRTPLADPPCSIQVFDRGTYELESEYLPAVVTCEDDGAGPEALRAQAIAARSVAYYAHATQGGICDGQACQVFSCGREATEAARRAVRETSGMYLSFNGILSYGFYVAGDAETSAPGCQGGPRAGTEKWVTYNEGRGDLDIQQTRLGYVHQREDPGFGQNRGCMSQWGARCLENSMAYSTRDILNFYYGRDIEVLVAGRTCSAPS